MVNMNRLIAALLISSILVVIAECASCPPPYIECEDCCCAQRGRAVHSLCGELSRTLPEKRQFAGVINFLAIDNSKIQDLSPLSAYSVLVAVAVTGTPNLCSQLEDFSNANPGIEVISDCDDVSTSETSAEHVTTELLDTAGLSTETRERASSVAFSTTASLTTAEATAGDATSAEPSRHPTSTSINRSSQAATSDQELPTDHSTVADRSTSGEPGNIVRRGGSKAAVGIVVSVVVLVLCAAGGVGGFFCRRRRRREELHERIYNPRSPGVYAQTVTPITAADIGAPSRIVYRADVPDSNATGNVQENDDEEWVSTSAPVESIASAIFFASSGSSPLNF